MMTLDSQVSRTQENLFCYTVSQLRKLKLCHKMKQNLAVNHTFIKV